MESVCLAYFSFSAHVTPSDEKTETQVQPCGQLHTRPAAACSFLPVSQVVNGASVGVLLEKQVTGETEETGSVSVGTHQEDGASADGGVIKGSP